MATPELWILTALVFLGTFVWRALGAVIGARINPDGALFQWISCVSYAMLAGLMCRVLLLPVGTLAATPTIDRIAALAAGFVLFVAFRRHVFAGTIGAFAVYLALAWARAIGML